jgi:hypothetical protein
MSKAVPVGAAKLVAFAVRALAALAWETPHAISPKTYFDKEKLCVLMPNTIL